jgi:hypothetical protein
MLGGKMIMNAMNPMMRPVESIKPEVSNNMRNTTTAEVQDKTYENILNEKTSIINKKKPKLRLFNSNLNEERSISNVSKVEKVSVTNENKDESPFKKQENQPMIETNNNKSQFLFDEIPDMKVVTVTPELPVEKPKENPTKSSLFDFDDTEVKDDNKKKNNSNNKNNKNSTSGSKSGKIQFLFDD